MSYRPTALQEACLRAALLAGDAARDAWERVRDALRRDRLDGASESLLPLVYRNVVRLGLDAELDGLKGRYLLTWSRNQRTFDAVLPLVRALEGAGIEPIVLKGLALVARFYRDAGVRPMADVDVLVPLSDLGRTCELAASIGWAARHRVTPGFVRVKHAAPFEHPAGVACDIHWRVFEEAGAGDADEDVRAAAEAIVFQGARLRVLCPTDQLLHVCGHAARWDRVPPIRWVADAIVIVRDAPIDWARLVIQARRRRFVLRMRGMLGYLRQAMELAIPPSVEADLAREPVSILERLEYRVRAREHRVLGELPAYCFNCLRGEPRPLLAFPGYLRDAWELGSLAAVPGRALALAGRRIRRAMSWPAAQPDDTPRPLADPDSRHTARSRSDSVS